MGTVGLRKGNSPRPFGINPQRPGLTGQAIQALLLHRRHLQEKPRTTAVSCRREKVGWGSSLALTHFLLVLLVSEDMYAYGHQPQRVLVRTRHPGKFATRLCWICLRCPRVQDVLHELQHNQYTGAEPAQTPSFHVLGRCQSSIPLSPRP